MPPFPHRSLFASMTDKAADRGSGLAAVGPKAATRGDDGHFDRPVMRP